ncbi:MAG TPA: transcriptional coactivator p15/PC4 family protein [Thermoclostridium sp.]|nr:transcriptional coactivator p15/PC4 family protein [Thermoclostridium sp.]
MASFWDKEDLIGKITKNSREEIHIKQVSKSGRDYIDIRTFWYDSNEDAYKPSQKGLAIPMDCLSQLRTILENVVE